VHRLTYLPLHNGKAPRWLFARMVRLGERISYAIIDEYGADELLSRLTDTNWFQALACALAMIGTAVVQQQLPSLRLKKH